MKFTISGGVFTSPMLERIHAFIRRMPDGQLLTSTALADQTHVSFGTFQTSVRHYIAPELCCITRGKKLYGNPKTIRAWRQQQARLQHRGPG